MTKKTSAKTAHILDSRQILHPAIPKKYRVSKCPSVYPQNRPVEPKTHPGHNGGKDRYHETHASACLSSFLSFFQASQLRPIPTHTSHTLARPQHSRLPSATRQ